MSLLIRACIFAAESHSGQKRKSGKEFDYIVHPLRVVKHLQDAGETNEKILAAAVLHDTVEDCGVKLELIAEKFGDVVAEYVQEVTDDKSLPPSERKKLQIINAPKKSIGATHIKLADKLDNCWDLLENSPKGWTTERVQAYFLWSRAVVRQLPIGDTVASNLKAKLESIFNSDFSTKHNCIPQGDETTILNAYYNSLDTKKIQPSTNV